MLKENRGDLLISVNGAYPGGETCRIVNIAWNSLGYGKSIHNIHNFAVPYRWFFAFYERPLDYFLSRSCDFFVGVSQVCSDSLRLRPTFKNNDNIVTIFNGLSPPNKLNKATIKFNDYLKVPTEEKVLLMLAGYEPRKGHRFLLNSMKHVFEFHPKIHLVICGDGSKKDRMEIEELVSRIVPNQNIHLLGYIPNAADLIKQAYVLLISSQEFESFGLTAVEAMQRSTPIVSTDVGGLPEVIGKNGVCGFCCPRDNPSIFAEKIIYLLENPNLAKKMGRNGLTRVKNLFRADIMAKKYSDLLRT